MLRGMWHALVPTAFGVAAIVWHDAGVTGFWLPESAPGAIEAALARRVSSSAAAHVPAWVSELATRVSRHFEGRLQDFADAPLDWTIVGEFQREVYRHAQAVKAGSTCTYGEIARLMGLPAASARAVGAALGSNPWPLLVPCHRVVAASGKMTGFSAPGGIRTKTRLLALEGAELRLE